MGTRTWFSVVAVLVFVLASFGAVRAQESEGAVQLQEKTVKIIGKADEALYISELKYVVTDMTEIKSPSGGALTLDELKVPCRAKIEYYYPAEENIPTLTSVKVIGYLPYASATPSAEMRLHDSGAAAW